ncbi:MAG: DUF3164 family protein [Mariprofundaceae bacterium]
MSKETPNGYMKNAMGHLVPVAQVKAIDAVRDQLVESVVGKFRNNRDQLSALKKEVLEDIRSFMELSAEEYGIKLGGKKGNVTLTSFDGSLKMQLQIAEYISFDERLQVAKQLIDECIHAWSAGARTEIMVLVNDAFQVDKEGQVSVSRILGLRRLDITDTSWQQAMTAISDSITIVGSKTYVRVYERVGGEDQWKVISLDFAAVEVAQ